MASKVPVALCGCQKEGQAVECGKDRLMDRKSALDAIDSIVLFDDFSDQEPIQNLKSLLALSETQGGQTQLSAQFVQSLIRSLRQLPLMPDLSLWQNYFANLILSSRNVEAVQLLLDSEQVDRGVLGKLLDRDLATLALLLLLPQELVAGSRAEAAFQPVGCSGLAGFKSATPVMAIRRQLLSSLAKAILDNSGIEELCGTVRSTLSEAIRLLGPGPLGMSHVLSWCPPEGRLLESFSVEECLSYLVPVMEFDHITFDDLIGYEEQKERIIQNTRQLSAGAATNNILLYGDRGTGKSSMVKAAASAFASEGVRLIGIRREQFRDIPALCETIGSLPQKFIIFVDDLSFEEHETEYKHMKALLEGGVRIQPENVVIYATSNRRHLVTERFSDVDGLNQRDTAEEKLSLSDRFGITLTFIAPSQKEYLRIVRTLAVRAGLDIDREALERMAIRWAMRGNGMSGRTAKQFIRDLTGRLSSDGATNVNDE